jgi:hypothetical protein
LGSNSARVADVRAGGQAELKEETREIAEAKARLFLGGGVFADIVQGGRPLRGDHTPAVGVGRRIGERTPGTEWQEQRAREHSSEKELPHRSTSIPDLRSCEPQADPE